MNQSEWIYEVDATTVHWLANQIAQDCSGTQDDTQALFTSGINI